MKTDYPTKPSPLYLCDKRACKHCSPECRHTKDITHAKNFNLGIDGVTMVEQEPAKMTFFKRRTKCGDNLKGENYE